MDRFFSLGLIGHPFDQSLSPVIHTAALASLGLNGIYKLFPVLPLPEGTEQLELILERLRRGEITGLNVTIPHKQVLIPYLDGLTHVAESIGAVNTIFLDGENLIGDNTDAGGFLSDLMSVFDLKSFINPCALVLGAGGAARAVVYALSQQKWKIYVAARQVAQAQELISKLCFDKEEDHAIINILPLDSRAMKDCLLREDIHFIVNATPLGMGNYLHSSPWPRDLQFPNGAMVYDLVYNPSETKLLKSAKAAGLETRNGLGMLIEQAALAFEVWTGLKPSRKELWQSVITKKGIVSS